METIRLRHIGYVIIALKIILVAFLLISVLPNAKEAFVFDSTFLQFMLIGFVAQIIDGTLGMAYGVSCSSFLLGIGVPPAVATASVHTAEVFTTGVSGLAHIRLRNIDKKLFFKLGIGGIIGASIGAFLISDVLDGKLVKPYIAAYLLILGIVILVKGLRNKQSKASNEIKRTGLLGFFGGFLDAIGGGGWGPLVTSNLIQKGKDPGLMIGTVNTAEFFISFVSTGVFLFFVAIDSWMVILGLILGGVIAAPAGAILAKKIPKKSLMIMVGIVVVTTSLITIYKAFF
jgi:uncharacterized membrane protein YfcA